MIFINELALNFEKTPLYIFKFSTRASRQYRRYTIPKRTGGIRTIYQPSKELKSYQRYIVKKIFQKLPIHESVYSYRKNLSIKNLAEKHKNDRFLLRIDFKDFFPSIHGENIRKFLTDNKNLPLEISDKEITLINLIVCKSNALTIGAPSSPIISNTILFDFDKDLDEYCKTNGIKYSRYSDDLYFTTSINDKLKDIIGFVKNYKFKFDMKLKINEKKNIFSSKKSKRLITGLSLTTENKVSIGRKQKRYLKSLINNFKYNNLEISKLNYLKGYLAYLKSVEPEYIDLLSKKYSEELIKELFLN